MRDLTPQIPGDIVFGGVRDRGPQQRHPPVCTIPTMHPIVFEKRGAIAAVCRHYRVRRLDVFGSAARGTDFDTSRSDVDFLVEFDADPRDARLADWLDLKLALEAVVGRSVDLVEHGALRNPFVRADVDRSRQAVYGA